MLDEIAQLRQELATSKQDNTKVPSIDRTSEALLKAEIAQLREDLKKKPAEPMLQPAPAPIYVPPTPAPTVDMSGLERQLSSLNATISALQSKINELEGRAPAPQRIIATPSPTFSAPTPAPNPAPTYSNRSTIYDPIPPNAIHVGHIESARKPVTRRTLPILTTNTTIANVQPSYNDLYQEVLRYANSDVYFDLNSTNVRASEMDKIGNVATLLNKHPQARLSISGHADRVGSATANLRVSQRRAEAVRNLLTGKYGVEAYRLLVSYFGFDQAPRIGADPLWRKAEMRFLSE